MRMWKMGAVALVAVGAFGVLAWADFEKGLGFIAPQINDRANVSNPVPGEILLDTSDQTFYGRDNSGNWINLNGAAAVLPAGVILPFGGGVEPAGYFFCDGRPVSRTTYASLFAAIGTSFGDGDGSTTFNLPDFRGRFLRGVDDGAGRDPNAGARTAMQAGGASGDSVGSVQGHAFQTHTHVQNSHNHAVSDPGHNHTPVFAAGGSPPPTGGFTFPSGSAAYTDIGIRTSTNTTGISIVGQTAINQNAAASGAHAQASADETRPVNAYVQYIIKH